jgi:hypothetical protein
LFHRGTTFFTTYCYIPDVGAKVRVGRLPAKLFIFFLQIF